MRGHQTRRTALRSIAASASWVRRAAAQTDNDPLRLLRVGHPRLILLDSDLDRLRVAARDHPVARRIFGDLEKEADRLLSIPPVEYKLTGPRLQVQTRRAIDRISTLALMYRMTGRDPWLRRAIMELNAAASFRDWNPARFVETAEMTHAFAIGYDWLFNSLSTDERLWIRESLVTKGLDPALPIYQQKAWWTREHFYWNIVCNSGMTLGALAVADDEGAKAGEIVRGALESMPHALASFGTDGGWPEGPSYGELAGRYASLFFSALETALGNDYGLSGFHGLDRAGRFRLYTTGPSNKTFNFGDAVEDPGLAPELFWMAKRFSTPAYSWAEQRQLERSGRPDALDLAWFDRDAKPPAPPAFVPDAVFHGVSVASFRSSWDDPVAVFLAVKGGDNKASHAHLDLGTFVLDAGGVRWASDLGPDDVTAGAPRNTLFRVRTEAHNTLLIDGENQDAKAEARIVRQELTPDFSWVQIDLSKTSPRVRQWNRRIGLAQRQAVLIEDVLRSDLPVDVIWSMLTDADITSVNGATATLHKNGWNLAAEIRTPRHAVFDTAPARTPASQPQNVKFQRLIVRMLDKVTELDLNIVLTPHKDGQPKPKITTQFPVT